MEALQEVSKGLVASADPGAHKPASGSNLLESASAPRPTHCHSSRTARRHSGLSFVVVASRAASDFFLKSPAQFECPCPYLVRTHLSAVSGRHFQYLWHHRPHGR